MNPPAPATYFDHIDRERTIRSHEGARGVLARHFKALGFTVLTCVAAYLIYAFSGLLSAAPASGRIVEQGVRARAEILRDGRGVPHLRAASEHDLFFAEGFAQASDRLVQMDLLRRYVYGQISEIIGPIQLHSDIDMRYLDAKDIVDRQWRHLSQRDRVALQAFSDGVNSAMRDQPLPFEFRFFLYQPGPWTPKDSLAVTLGVCASLDDSVSNVLARDALWHKMTPRQFDAMLPLSDALYDVTASGQHATPAASASGIPVTARAVGIHRSARGSNAWGAGAQRTSTHRALIANDPHLDLSIPGIWYLVEMRAPGFHAAGATIPGIPGVILGHNERVAWATTNGMAGSVSLFRPQKLDARYWKREVFHVRLAPDVVRAYYRAPHEIGVPADRDGSIALARWPPYESTRSPLSTVFDLNRATSVREAIQALAHYAGPAQNFVVADRSGVVAYRLAGPIANDPAWGRYVHPASDLRRTFASISFARLPSTAPSRSALVVSANNKMYGEHYPLRLSPEFAPPYRAYRIAQLLAQRKTYDVAYFTRMQLDVVSPADAEIAHRAAAFASQHSDVLDAQTMQALRSWNGSYDTASSVASLEHALRADLEQNALSPYAPFQALRARQMPAQVQFALHDVGDVQRPWGETGAVPVMHPMGNGVLAFLNGALLPGSGNEYTVRVQTPTLAQSFRAVWDVGNWDAGGITIPSGESGERRSPHYADQSDAWIHGQLLPLPFSDRAVRAQTRETLIFVP